ncbi:hypothetical protein [Henriciella sp.]|uniref:hypothetical protein n=1 Tax=Henriciella sp. TaxID=1968823 RepID=UPI002616FFDF|nr:hypothetical protein [Henriciella sp.]
MPSKRGNMFYAEPIDADSLRELLHYYVQSGVGLPVSEKGVPGQWTDVGLEAALAEIGINVDKRSIQSWLSGASVPKVEKLKGLASLASSDRFERERWTAAFIRLRRKALDERRREQQASPAATTNQPARLRWRPALAVLAAVISLAGVTYVILQLLGPAPVAENIRFCDEVHFSTDTKRCTQSMTEFPDGLKTLMITFDLNNVAKGETFTRNWYRNGRNIHTKTSFHDEAWPGYTYWHWPEGFDDGEYTLQIVSGDRTVTKTFQVGKGEGELVYH